MSTYRRNGVILKAENINLSYDNRVILRDVNFNVEDIIRPDMIQGQIISLVGRSGIGKSQMFKILSGILQPSISDGMSLTGNVKIGVDQHIVQAGEVGIVPQNYILFNHRTILQNLQLGLRGATTKLPKNEQKTLIEDYSNKFGLTEHLTKYPMQLSGGQRQRVSIIQQILTGNEFILFDEPFSGLDPVVKDKVTELLSSISLIDELKTLVLVSHDLESSLAISDTAFILAKEEGLEGATITETIDLMQMGLAWEPNIKKNKNFIDLVYQMKYKI